jgi:indole-3-glycerol phosphate synthase
MTLLASILEAKRRSLAALPVRRAPRTSLREPFDVVGALSRGRDTGLRLVAEIKRRSPSAGPLSQAMTPAERAVAYARGGASMVSVLCDGPFFDGSWEHLEQARAALDADKQTVPLLAKEFVIDESQIVEARHRGADAILLIARILSRERLIDLANRARSERLEPFVEVIDDAELDAALAARARIIGVNARDLDTLVMDAARARRIVDRIPSDIVAVHLSGLRDPSDVAAMAAGRADAALIGEALMRDEDPGPRLRAMVLAALRGREARLISSLVVVPRTLRVP